MYASCIFCTADLGRNDTVEQFPIGARLAYDAHKGFVWAVCPRCGRWNLAPIEERWEAVETAEKQFAETRRRVQRGRIGLASLANGTELVRVGDALPGEIAAWRYGSTLRARRRRHALIAGAGITAAAALFWLPGLAVGAASLTAFDTLATRHALRRVMLVVGADESPTSGDLTIRQQHLLQATVHQDDHDIAVSFPVPHATSLVKELRLQLQQEFAWGLSEDSRRKLQAETSGGPRVTIRGDAARRLLARVMATVNAHGATQEGAADALALLEKSPSSREFIDGTDLSALAFPSPFIGDPPAEGQQGHGSRSSRFGYEPGGLTRVHRLALEMALNEDVERRALEGELAALQDAWEEADTIARIADGL